MSNQTPPASDDELPEVNEVLAQALVAQGAPGVRALGLLRDARRVLTGTTLERPGEVAESCLRGAADALLSLPGAPARGMGLKAAAIGLLDAHDALPPSIRPTGAVPPSSPPAADPAAWDRVDAAAETLRGELARPGGYHRGRAAGIAERLMGVRLGAAQEEALDVWGEVYGKTSGTLHGGAADEDRPARLYAEVVAAARELLVPLPGRAQRVLELTALERPGPDQVLELARWADPRATAFFFRSRPAAAWLPLLREHAPHLLLPDAAAGGAWPAAAYFEHLADTAPVTAGAWLADHAVAVAAAGRPARDAVLRLAGSDAALVPPALVRAVLDEHAAGRPAGEEPGPAEARTLELAAEWACAVPVAARDRDWILVAERLLKAAVDAEHTADRHLQTVAAGARASRPGNGLRRHFHGDPVDWAAAVRADTARMPEHLAGRLLQELVATARPGGPAAVPHRSVRMIRAVALALLVRDVDLTAPAARRIVFHEDLDRVRLDAPPAFGGPLLARAVLDLAAADADAGESLAERTAQWHKTAAADAWLADRIWAAHLTARAPGRCVHDDLHETPPAAAWPAPEADRWHALAYELVPRLLGGHPDPEPARLVETVWRSCTPQATAELEAEAEGALGRPPTTGDIAAVLPEGTRQADGTLEPLASWLRVWDWAPVLPARLLTAFAPLLTALRRLDPDGPADPRVGARPLPVKAPTDIGGTDLLELAAEHGPLATARVLAAAKGADGADGHARLIGRLVDTDPAAWTADVPAVLAELEAPVLRAIYLTAAQAAAHLPGALPGQSLAHAVAAALQLCALRPAGAPAGTLDRFADTALFGLLTEAWHRPAGPAGLGDLLPTALTHLHALAEPLTHPAAASPPTNPPAPADDPSATTAADGPPPPATAVRALECLLDYVLALAARPGPANPGDVLHLLGAILTAGSARPAVSAAYGARLLALSICVPDFTADHRAALTTLDGGPTPAAAWLNSGPVDPTLLASLDHTAVLEALRPGAGGPVEHLTHALTTDPHTLGDPADVLTRIAAGPGGPEAVSWLLQVMAWSLDPQQGSILFRPFSITRIAARPATASELAAVTTVWRAALTADLPPGALAGAGYFADLALDDQVWLPLARASAEHTSPHTPAVAAWRAAAHPGDRDALLLTTRLVARPSDLWGARDVLRPARALLQAAEAVACHPHPDAVAQLREALINAGELDAAWTPGS
ncbi:hypothetical protein [Streptomyces sp. NBC_01174]|uniref:hypothetical protein n=1 Tax=Streptomyces sp. NBC_01174 TaxID=2903758 RepID=UPI002F907902|nr:hypothetical protein OG414_39230 [Streptomyces sp. NBC_01174]